jgi:phosphatidylinositol glycan class U
VFICLGLVFLNVVGPIMWHLWINQGTGNANFFYAMTLIFFLFQVLPPSLSLSLSPSRRV